MTLCMAKESLSVIVTMRWSTESLFSTLVTACRTRNSNTRTLKSPMISPRLSITKCKSRLTSPTRVLTLVQRLSRFTSMIPKVLFSGLSGSSRHSPKCTWMLMRQRLLRLRLISTPCRSGLKNCPSGRLKRENTLSSSPLVQTRRMKSCGRALSCQKLFTGVACEQTVQRRGEVVWPTPSIDREKVGTCSWQCNHRQVFAHDD